MSQDTHMNASMRSLFFTSPDSGVDEVIAVLSTVFSFKHTCKMFLSLPNDFTFLVLVYKNQWV